ncbi:hypothetical protein O9G_002427 [Rozella allomycis CSF55]|uniref:Pectin lyase fold/virulence factor domain-containing protein n=1 Tax=Rozella allomycis (strain CSF55) TaxID=988480 RepID=A0A075AXF8_ROZAC|nr:hypothetical protein O9G_002427 [Rozella allomycis CSF55]|eukprot:EPZ34829.1 hypothetical protein O9G_002427 [Rozella allomycis CSF55]
MSVNLVLRNLTVQNNTSTGSILSLEKFWTTKIHDSVFENNYNEENGGALELLGMITSTTAYDVSVLEIGGKFLCRNNTSKGLGGCLFMSNIQLNFLQDNVNIEMSKNNATRGGAIYWEQMYPKVDSISSLSRNVLMNFTSNVATYSGGALYLDGVNFYGFLSNLVMDGNQAYYGGAFTIDNSFITMIGIFTNNFASYGAVFCINRTSDASSLTIGGNVRGNYAKYSGSFGHLVVFNSSYLILDSVYVGTDINFSSNDLTPIDQLFMDPLELLQAPQV